MFLEAKDEDILFHYTKILNELTSQPITIIQYKVENWKDGYKIFSTDIPIKEFIQILAKQIGITAKYMYYIIDIN